MHFACGYIVTTPVQSLEEIAVDAKNRYDFSILITVKINATWRNASRYILSQKSETCDSNKCFRAVETFYSELSIEQLSILATCMDQQCERVGNNTTKIICSQHSRYFRYVWSWWFENSNLGRTIGIWRGSNYCESFPILFIVKMTTTIKGIDICRVKIWCKPVAHLKNIQKIVCQSCTYKRINFPIKSVRND